MRRCIKFAILVGFLAMLLASMGFVSAQEGQGRTWVVDFGTESAKRDGKITFQITVRYKFIWESEKMEELTIEVKKDWTPQQKAEALEKQLNDKLGEYLIVSRDGQVVSVQLKKGATHKGATLLDIVGAKLKEEILGEKGIHIYDDVSMIYPEIVTFDIEGTPIDNEGVAILKIGLTYPLVSVHTYGKSLSTIKSELVYWFNYHYNGTGFVAEINYAGKIEIHDVPCQEGITGGADDPALSWTLSMGDPPPPVGGIVTPVNKLALLAPWIILAALIAIVAASVAVYWRRR